MADYIETPQDVRAYLNVVLEENDLGVVYEALGPCARCSERST